MSDDRGIWNALHELAASRREFARKRREEIAQKRAEAQRRPDVAASKSRAMKEYWARRRAADAEAKKEAERLRAFGPPPPPQECTCHLGHPPCAWCTDQRECDRCGRPFFPKGEEGVCDLCEDRR